ncbi:putative metalloprotease CJM1_0395 family protein [Gammaproteobacteria bacterium AB-CW1]|uniref:Metalloprotease CJM1_0395 family protein n=1 Tax=Natronospira elongata TaxID=3110268 RepID=A0AAP6JDD6_9GAMM|nr:putative metalloprotease CJM1_0395 family protein [Gammaproteobacteria bacterium AB-CW1]
MTINAIQPAILNPAITTQNRPVAAVEAGRETSPGAGPAARKDGVAEAEEQRQVRELRRIDQEVRAHEQAHARVGGRFAGPPQLQMVRGPNGEMFAVGGSVSIDTSPVPNDPEATLEKMETVRRAALAPAQPSPEDLAIAARASVMAQQARVEMMRDDREDGALPGSPGERLLDALDRSGAIREPAEPGQLLDQRA